MPWLVNYKEETFVEGPTKDKKVLIWTYIREKGLRYGFNEHTYDSFNKWVNIEEIKRIRIEKAGIKKYRVQYNNHFFPVREETQDKAKLEGTTVFLNNLFQFESNPDETWKWVNKSEITPIHEIMNQRRLGLCLSYNDSDHCSGHFYWGPVFDVLDEKKGEYLLASNASDEDDNQAMGSPWWS